MTLSNFRQLARALRRNTSGVALLEFGLAIPILIPVVALGLDGANLAVANLRVSQMATMVADNGARVRDRIDESDINEIMTGARLAGQGIDFMNKGRVVLSSVEDNDATAATDDSVVTWQRCKGVLNPGATLTTEGQVITGGVGTGTNKISPAPRNPVIFVEAYYRYDELFPVISGPVYGNLPVIRYTSAFSVRDRLVEDMQNGGNLGASSKATCNYYTAT